MRLPPAEAFHLARVLRRRPGDSVIVLGAGGEALEAVMDSVAEDRSAGADGLRVQVRILGPAALAAPGFLPWKVGLALAKGNAFELAVRMASELGLERIVPVSTARTVVRPESGPRAARKLERWARIARESAKQCGRAEPLQVEESRPFDAFLASSAAPRKWIAVPGGPVRLEPLVSEAGGPLSESVFLVGPEGGFTPEELERARASGFKPLGFPTPVLRTPTAVALIAALGVILESLES